MTSRPPTLAADRPFFGRLEALRGLGAMAVAGYHFTGCGAHGFSFLQSDQWPAATPLQYAIAQVGRFLLPGHAFLMGFFVISGFVLRLSLEHGPRTVPQAAAKFVLARMFRFYPIVIVGVLVSALVGPPGETLEGPLTARRFVGNLFLLDVSLNRHLWALQVELLMVPIIFLLYLLERRWGPYTLLGAALVTTGLAFASWWAVWRPLSVNLFAFVVGMTLPTLGRRFATALSVRAATRWVVVSAVILLMAGPCLGVYSMFTTVLEAYAFAGMIALAAYRPEVSSLSWLDSRWLNRIGSASGSYYVLHMTTVSSALGVVTVVIPAAWSARAPGVVGFGVIAIWLVAIAPLMICVFHLVESPGVALGCWVTRSLGLGSPTRIRPETSFALVSRAA
jgi:peptidoglycan/LPS O-acetylase OafA/YrhL